MAAEFCGTNGCIDEVVTVLALSGKILSKTLVCVYACVCVCLLFHTVTKIIIL